MKILALFFQLLGHLLYRKMLCRFGWHRMTSTKTDTLALGERLSVPACSIYGCGYINTKGAVLTMPNDGNNGTLIEMHHPSGRAFAMGRTTDSNFRKGVGLPQPPEEVLLKTSKQKELPPLSVKDLPVPKGRLSPSMSEFLARNR